MKKVKALFHNAKVRLGARAVTAGLVYAFSHLKGHAIDHTLLVSVLVGGGWSALEIVTPLNGILGVFKQAEKVDPALAKFAPPTDLKPPAA